MAVDEQHGAASLLDKLVKIVVGAELHPSRQRVDEEPDQALNIRMVSIGEYNSEHNVPSSRNSRDQRTKTSEQYIVDARISGGCRCHPDRLYHSGWKSAAQDCTSSRSRS